MSKPVKTPTPSKLLFLKQYLNKPFGTGSITPSSRKLAQLMVNHLEFEVDEVVVELGPGTGAFTRALLEQGVLPENLILVEFNPDFAKYLRIEFPDVRILEGDACKLPQLLAEIGIGAVKRIVSGIPLRGLKPAQRKQLTIAIADSLQTYGVAVQFTYFKIPPLPAAVAEAHGLSGKQVANTFENVPPAFVWRYVKSVMDYVST